MLRALVARRAAAASQDSADRAWRLLPARRSGWGTSWRRRWWPAAGGCCRRGWDAGADAGAGPRGASTATGTGDVRDYLHERRHPMPALFEQATGLAWAEFLRAGPAELRRAARTTAAVALLGGLPRGRLRCAPARARGWAIVGRAARPRRPRPRVCTLQHLRLPPYDGRRSIPIRWRRERSCGRTDERGAVPARCAGEYGRGERAFVALDCELPGLALPGAPGGRAGDRAMMTAAGDAGGAGAQGAAAAAATVAGRWRASCCGRRSDALVLDPPDEQSWASLSWLTDPQLGRWAAMGPWRWAC